MNDILSFRKMITPVFIQAIFWIVVIMVVVASLITMITQSFFAGLIGLVLGPLFIRIYCELLIILFRIYDELVAIRTGTPPGGQGFPVMPPGSIPPSAHTYNPPHAQ
jgi:hypothetical protein